jgi:hypothetical protein
MERPLNRDLVGGLRILLDVKAVSAVFAQFSGGEQMKRRVVAAAWRC